METFLASLYENSTFPLLSAFLLGLLTAISPCPMATNITAIGYISRNIEHKSRVFYNGIIYTAGRAFSYTILAFILFIGADKTRISFFFQQYGEKILGPLLIVVGLFMLGIFQIRLPVFSRLSERVNSKSNWNFLNVFLLGVVYALAFCPYSGVLYFGMLIPMTIGSAGGLYLPVVFAIATGIPVIIIAWILAFAISNIGRFYDSMKKVERWMRRLMAVLFIGVGVYYILAVWMNIF
jgi:cytochrome c biogenesis protein CcdA